MPGSPVEREGAILTDRYDRRVWGDLTAASEPLQELEGEARQKLDTSGELLQDSWASLYKVQPQLRADLPPALSLNREIMAQMMDTPEWKDLREVTKLDEYASALGTLSLSDALLKAIPEDARRQANELNEAQRQVENLTQSAQTLLDMAQAAQEMGDSEKAKELAQHAANRRQEISSWKDKAARLQGLTQKQQRAVKKGVKAAMKEATADFNDTNDNAEAFIVGWGTEAGVPHQVAKKEKFEIALTLRQDPKLLMIAKMAGRVTRVALAKRRTKARQEPTEIVDVEVGSNLSRVLPAELSKLSHPILGRDFKLRFVEGKLLQYRLDGKAPQGRGPIVACVDSSGSMNGAPEVWSKAVALALFHVAAREKRAFALVYFGSRDQIKVFEFATPAKAHATEVAEAAAFQFGGGTDFETPLTEAMEVLKKSAFQRGDIVFVTDGQCRVSDGFLKDFRSAKAQKEFSVFSIVMPGGTTESVRPFSDKTFYTEPSNDRETLDILFDDL